MSLACTLGSQAANGKFLLLLLFGVGFPALEFAGLWLGPDLSVEVETFGKFLTD